MRSAARRCWSGWVMESVPGTEFGIMHGIPEYFMVQSLMAAWPVVKQ